jgi:peptidoglycan/LPS O-acetylase OafA/YrhL
VDVFFVISGFVMTLVTRDEFGRAGAAGRFLLRRAIRIAPPYWFFTTLLVAIVLVAPHSVRYTTVDAPVFITSYLFIPWPRGDGQLNPILSQGWTLNYEAFFYSAFAATLLFRRGLVLLAVCFFTLALAHPFVPAQAFLLGFYTSPIILEVLAGIALARVYMSGFRLPLWGASLCVAAAVASVGLFDPSQLGSFAPILGWGLPALLLTSALVLSPEPQHQGTIRRWLQRGGDASYTIYLSHTLTINALAVVWMDAGIGVLGFGFMLAVVTSIAAAMLFYRLIESPVTSWLQRSLLATPAPAGQTVAP